MDGLLNQQQNECMIVGHPGLRGFSHMVGYMFAYQMVVGEIYNAKIDYRMFIMLKI